MTTAEVVILAIVEGLTEFLPVSSTGHMILTEAALRMQNAPFNKLFIVNIQFGAILAVVVLYRKRFFQSLDFYFKLFVAFIPAAVFGFLLHKHIEKLLSSVYTVALSFIVGGVVLIFIDRIFHQQIEDAATDSDTEEIDEVDEFGIERKKEVLKRININFVQAFIIGCCQCIAMIPGVSRSAAAIVGGMSQKLNIKRAAEFSFFLAVPTIFGAAALELKQFFDHSQFGITGDNISDLIWGNLISFVVGMLAIRFFIGLITRYGLKFFGYYRIIVGVIILILMATGHKLEIPD